MDHVEVSMEQDRGDQSPSPPPQQNQPAESNREDRQLISFWSGLYQFIEGPSSTETEEVEIHRLREELAAEKSMTECLLKQIKDRDIEVSQLRSFFEHQVKESSEAMKAFLRQHAQERAAERMEERKVLQTTFAKHDDLVRDHARAVGLYEKLREKAMALHGEWKLLNEQNEALVRSNAEMREKMVAFEDRVLRAEKKVRDMEAFFSESMNRHGDEVITGRRSNREE